MVYLALWKMVLYHQWWCKIWLLLYQQRYATPLVCPPPICSSYFCQYNRYICLVWMIRNYHTCKLVGGCYSSQKLFHYKTGTPVCDCILLLCHKRKEINCFLKEFFCEFRNLILLVLGHWAKPVATIATWLCFASVWVDVHMGTRLLHAEWQNRRVVGVNRFYKLCIGVP